MPSPCIYSHTLPSISTLLLLLHANSHHVTSTSPRYTTNTKEHLIVVEEAITGSITIIAECPLGMTPNGDQYCSQCPVGFYGPNCVVGPPFLLLFNFLSISFPSFFPLLTFFSSRVSQVLCVTSQVPHMPHNCVRPDILIQQNSWQIQPIQLFDED